MARVRLEHLTTKTFNEGKFDTAIVPVGSCESHGDHMPFGTDALIAHELSLAVADRLDRTAVLPPTSFGYSHLYRHKPMAISLRQETNISLITDILRSLAYWKIKNVLIINGHDGNIAAMDVAAHNVREEHPEMNVAALDAWWVAIENLVDTDFFEAWGGRGHGGEAETSLGLALIPQYMDMQLARGMIPDVDPNVRQYWHFSELTGYGASGDPTKATLKKGEAMRDTLVEYVANFMTKRREQNWTYSPRPMGPPEGPNS
ncbi:creatininase family protein [Aminobacter sp. MSH1]|uniref:creatininase family protein n=1 Tax=Aminobacter sp. MSH1 TaxID=374606 RepID=UPI000D370DFE|nr:creatininase family protein [Aminobacter sp. MSH1]